MTGRVAWGAPLQAEWLGPETPRTSHDYRERSSGVRAALNGCDFTRLGNVTHLGRSATVAQKVALWWQSPMCDVEGCTRTQRSETDHRYEWAKMRRTRLDELDRLCDHHHDLKTYFGWALVAGEGPREMVPPDDPATRMRSRDERRGVSRHPEANPTVEEVDHHPIHDAGGPHSGKAFTTGDDADR